MRWNEKVLSVSSLLCNHEKATSVRSAVILKRARREPQSSCRVESQAVKPRSSIWSVGLLSALSTAQMPDNFKSRWNRRKCSGAEADQGTAADDIHNLQRGG